MHSYKDLIGIRLVDVYTVVAMVIAMLNFIKSIPACVTPGKGKNGSTVAVSQILGTASFDSLTMDHWTMYLKLP